MIGNLKFEKLRLGSRKDNLTGFDLSGNFFAKIQLFKLDRKRNALSEEYQIIQHLSHQGCQSCPNPVVMDKISKKDILNLVDQSDRSYVESFEKEEFDIMILETVDSNNVEYSLGDVLLSLLEQRSLGVYQGDVKPDNILFNHKKSICVLVDYDQAVLLSEEQRNYTNQEFFNFCNQYDREKYGFGNWLRHFDRFSANDFSQSFFGELLDLSKTSVMKNQVTTNSATGIYHSINGPHVYAKGSRTLNERFPALERIRISPGEKVLDVGCNMGLLSTYLSKKGCNVTGVDNDPRIVVLAKIVSNILGDEINYKHLDLDQAKSLNFFDTIFLFSVFHHTKYPIENAKKITSSCNRIIIETRLVESGKQPVNGFWAQTTRWEFETKEKLSQFLEILFEGFKCTNNIFDVDKKRYVIEMVKDV